MPVCKDLGKELIDCQTRARHYEVQAQSAADEETRKDLLRSRDQWLRRARGYEVAQNFLKSLPPKHHRNPNPGAQKT